MKWTFLLSLLMTALYIVLFASPLKKEPLFRPVWVDDLARPRVALASQGPVVGFRMGRIFGYATPDGGIRFLNTAQFGVAMEGDRFVNFSSVSQNLVMRDSFGRILSSVQSDGYPILAEGRYFVIDADRTALSELGAQQERKWSYDFGSVISCVAATKALLVVGLLDGSALVLDANGREIATYSPGGSRIPVIYGCAIAADGGRIALVSGLHPQRFVLLERSRSGYSLRKAIDLPTDFRSQVFLHFFPGIPYVYYEGDGAAGYVALRGKATGRLPLEGSVRAMALGPDSLIYVASAAPPSAGNTGAGRLTVLLPPASVIASASLPGRELFVSPGGAAAYLGADRTLMRIDYARN